MAQQENKKYINPNILDEGNAMKIIIDNKNEFWRDIIGYEGFYQISNFGRVRSLRNTHNNPSISILKAKREKKGYLRVTLQKNGNRKNYLIHRLVAQSFIPNRNDLPQVNHKDENPSNNNADNLEWCDNQYNIDYSKSKKVYMYNTDGILIDEFPSVSFAQKETGIRHISSCCLGKRKTAGGYIWKYIN